MCSSGTSLLPCATSAVTFRRARGQGASQGWAYVAKRASGSAASLETNSCPRRRGSRVSGISARGRAPSRDAPTESGGPPPFAASAGPGQDHRVHGGRRGCHRSSGDLLGPLVVSVLGAGGELRDYFGSRRRQVFDEVVKHLLDGRFGPILRKAKSFDQGPPQFVHH